MSNTPPVRHGDLGRGGRNLQDYLYSGTAGIDFSAQLLGTEQPSGLGAYRQIIDPTVDSQVGSGGFRSEPGTSGRNEARPSSRMPEDEGSYRIRNETVKTRDMNPGLVDGEYKKGRANPAGVNMVLGNGDCDPLRSLNGYPSESTLRNFTQQSKEQATFPDVTYSHLQQHHASIDPRLSLQQFLPTSAMFSQQIHPTFSRPYDMLQSLLPHIQYPREVSPFTVDRRANLSQPYSSPGHLGLRQSSASFSPYSDYSKSDIDRGTFTKYSSPYSSPLEMSIAGSDPHNASRRTPHHDAYPYRTNHPRSASTLPDLTKKYSQTVVDGGPFSGSLYSANGVRQSEPPTVDLTNSNSPDLVDARGDSAVRERSASSITRQPRENPRENGSHHQGDLSKGREYSRNLQQKRNQTAACHYPTSSMPPFAGLLPFAPSAAVPGYNSLTSRQFNLFENSLSDMARSHSASKVIDHSSGNPGGSPWPPTARCHTPSSRQRSSVESMKKNGFPSLQRQAKLAQPANALTFNYAEGSGSKSDISHSGAKHLDTTNVAKSRLWPKKDDSKLSPLENQIMDSARDGKPCPNFGKYDSLAHVRTRIPPTHHAASNNHVPRRIGHPTEHQPTKLLPSGNSVSSKIAFEPARNSVSVIQSVPKMVPTEEPSSEPKYLKNGPKSEGYMISEDKSMSNEIMQKPESDAERLNIANNSNQLYQVKGNVTSPLKPEGKRKLFKAKVQDGEQKPKRKYIKRSEVWKTKGLHHQRGQHSQQQQEEKQQPTVQPTTRSVLEQEKAEDSPCAKPATLEKSARPQRKSGGLDMEEYLYEWFTEDDTENDDSSDEDYSCPTKVNKIRGCRAVSNLRPTRRMPIRRSSEGIRTRESWDSDDDYLMEEGSVKKTRRGRQRSETCKTRHAEQDPLVLEPEETSKQEESEKGQLPDQNLVKMEEKVSEELEEAEQDRVVVEPEEASKQQESEKSQLPDQNLVKMEERVSEELEEAEQDWVVVEPEMASKQQESDKSSLPDQNLVKMEKKVPEDFKEKAAVAEVKSETLAAEESAEQCVEVKEYPELKQEPIRKKRKYTRRLDKDGLPIKRVRKIIKSGELIPKQKRKYTKTAEKWFKNKIQTENEQQNAQNDKIPSSICPALAELYTSSQDNTTKVEESGRALNTANIEIQKSPRQRKTSNQSTSKSFTISPRPDTMEALTIGAENCQENMTQLHQDSEDMLNSKDLFTASTDAENRKEGLAPQKLRKKRGRKPGWRKYPLVSKEGVVTSSTAKSSLPGIKKKYKKPKGDGLSRFGMRKRCRRPKLKLPTPPGDAIVSTPSRSEDTDEQPGQVRQKRKYNVASRREKKRQYLISIGRLVEAEDTASTSKLSTPSKISDVHKIREELQNQEYDYDFKSLAVYNHNEEEEDQDVNENSMSLYSFREENSEQPSSSILCQSRPQTPTDGTPLSQSPFPSHLKKLCCNTAIGETQLHKAARIGYVENLQHYLETGTNVNQSDNAGYTALHEACMRNHLEATTLLLQYGADVNKYAVDGTRPLHDSIEYDHLEMVRLMLACGADPMLSKFSGRSILNMIIKRSLEMKQFINAYLQELKEVKDGENANEGLEWKFPCSAVFDKLKPHQYNTLDFPPDFEELSVEFEMYDKPPCNTYLLQPDEDSERSNYCLLDDYLAAIGNSKRKFSNSIRVLSMPVKRFKRQIRDNKIQSLQYERTHLKPDFSGDFIEIVAAEDSWNEIPGSEIVKIPLFDNKKATGQNCVAKSCREGPSGANANISLDANQRTGKCESEGAQHSKNDKDSEEISQIAASTDFLEGQNALGEEAATNIELDSKAVVRLDSDRNCENIAEGNKQDIPNCQKEDSNKEQPNEWTNTSDLNNCSAVDEVR